MNLWPGTSPAGRIGSVSARAAAAAVLLSAAIVCGATAQSAGASSPVPATADPCPSPGASPLVASPGSSVGGTALPSVPAVSPDPCLPVAPTAQWGPMAMVHDTLHEGLDQGFGPGTLAIGDACVTFSGEGWETTLVFRDWQAEWASESRTILFQQPPDQELTLATGDQLILGGYAPWDEESSDGPPAPPWLVLPGPGCPAGLWLVHSASPA